MASDWDRMLDEDVPRLMALLRGLGLEEIAVEQDGRSVRLRRYAGELLQEQSEPAADGGDPAAAARDEGAVRAEQVGVFHRAPQDSTEPVAADGDSVDEGQTIAYIDVLGVFHEVVSPAAGSVEQFLVVDGQPVEFDQPLARLSPAADGELA